jgi:hypothetical protein
MQLLSPDITVTLSLQLRIHGIHYLYIPNGAPSIDIYADLFEISSQDQGSSPAT